MSDEVLQEIKTTLIRMEGKLDAAQGMASKNSSILFGEDGSNGISGRVRGLEARETSRSKNFKAIWAAIVAMATGIVSNWMGGHK